MNTITSEKNKKTAGQVKRKMDTSTKTGAAPKRLALAELHNRNLPITVDEKKNVADKNQKELQQTKTLAAKSRVNIGKRQKATVTLQPIVQNVRRSLRLQLKAESTAMATVNNKQPEPQNFCLNCQPVRTLPTAAQKETELKAKKPQPQKQSIKQLTEPTASFSSTKILESVRDIDAQDENTLMSVSTYVNDIYDYLFELELKQPITKQHLRKQFYITAAMRGTLIDWINDITSAFHLVLETYFLAVSIIDLYLQKTFNTESDDFQLLGMTALFIAAKYEEYYPPQLKDFAYVTDDACQFSEILTMEIRVLKTLDCQLSRPLSIQFLRRFAKAGDVEADLYAASKYFLELTTTEYSLAAVRPSENAAAALLLAIHCWQRDPKEPTGFEPKLWDATLEHYSHYTGKQLHSIVRKIAALTYKAPIAKLQAVYKKYKEPKNHAVSLQTRLYGQLMHSLAGSI